MTGEDRVAGNEQRLPLWAIQAWDRLRARSKEGPVATMIDPRCTVGITPHIPGMWVSKGEFTEDGYVPHREDILHLTELALVRLGYARLVIRFRNTEVVVDDPVYSFAPPTAAGGASGALVFVVYTDDTPPLVTPVAEDDDAFWGHE